MASFFLDETKRQITNATGISYEVPLITVVTNLRKVIARRRSRGRGRRRSHLARLRHAAGRPRAARADHRRRRRGKRVRRTPRSSSGAIASVKRQVDALWILNDDRLLTPRLIADGWLPGLTQSPRIPALVGAASLVSAKSSFGTFAVLPDHTALGVQAASLIYDIVDENAAIEADAHAVLPLSVVTILDLGQARDRLQLRADAVKLVDRILE